MTQQRGAMGKTGDGESRGLRTSRQPRYLQVSEILRDEIKRGAHPVGKSFPTEAKLCERFSISRFTARAALQLLTEHGLILRRRGAGTLVRSSETRISYEQHIRSLDDLLQYSNASGFQFLFTDRIEADAELAGWLNVRMGTECLHLHGIRHNRRSQQPYCVGEVYRRATWQGLPQGYARMEDALREMIEANFQRHIGRVEQTLSAVALTEEQAIELKVSIDTPGFRSVRHYFDLKGRLVLVAVTVHPGPLFSYHMRYERIDPDMRS
jgi:DNA-binding GntR family transcriptional regulator